MSIAFSLIFTRRRWTMPGAAGMPAGLWVAGNDDEGDASGGNQSFQHIFENVSNGLGDSNYYNLEEVMVSTSNTTAIACRVAITGMDPGTSRSPILQPVDQFWTFRMLTDDTSSPKKSIAGLEGTILPIWIGTFKGFDTEFGDILVSLTNVTASDRTQVKLQGYWWTPDAINAPGGMRRPPGSVYG